MHGQKSERNSMKIYGAGIAGLLAGNIFQDAEIIEAGSEGQIQHKALLRFRSSAVGDAVGIDFRKVTVNKGIWSKRDHKLVEPNIALANEYSNKVIGKYADRSIWNLAPVERFIAPEDFVLQLASRCKGRITWETPATAEDVFSFKEPAISTIPMSLMKKFYAQKFGDDPASQPEIKWESMPITVRRWRIPNADVFQTVYFPDQEISLFRASITGDLLIAEYMEDPRFDTENDWIHEILGAFGIVYRDRIDPIEKVNQRFGKIAPINDAWRKHFIFELSSQFGIYSLGRFGTWRNILLDDVLKDVSVIKKLLNSSVYERSKINAK